MITKIFHRENKPRLLTAKRSKIWLSHIKKDVFISHNVTQINVYNKCVNSSWQKGWCLKASLDNNIIIHRIPPQLKTHYSSFWSMFFIKSQFPRTKYDLRDQQGISDQETPTRNFQKEKEKKKTQKNFCLTKLKLLQIWSHHKKFIGFHRMNWMMKDEKLLFWMMITQMSLEKELINQESDS